ncbi:MAG: F0F1 ATP synthase subunit B [Actinomycetes bacterium]
MSKNWRGPDEVERVDVVPTASIFLLPNGTFFVELAIFLVIVFLIGKYILPPINKALEERQEHIKSSLEAADVARADAAAADGERRAALEEGRRQAREIVAQANGTADQVRAEAVTKAQVEYDRILAKADSEVAVHRQRAVEEAAGRMGEIVFDTVERVIGREVDATTHRDLIDAAVNALKADAAAAGAGSRP